MSISDDEKVGRIMAVMRGVPTQGAAEARNLLEQSDWDVEKAKALHQKLASAEKKEDEQAACLHTEVEFASAEIKTRDLIIHVNCRACGRSGSRLIETDEVSW
jgi:hypothetical protein